MWPGELVLRTVWVLTGLEEFSQRLWRAARQEQSALSAHRGLQPCWALTRGYFVPVSISHPATAR